MTTLKWGLFASLFIHVACANTVDLRILETSDIHANMMDYDFYKDDYTQRFGFTRTASLIRKMQNEVKNSVLVDNGDLIQGSPMADWAYSNYLNDLNDQRTHPAYKALNAMHYTVGGLGNHEFNYGLDFLNRVLAGATFPYINANIFDVKTDKPYFRPYVIIDTLVIDRDGKPQHLKIGYISFVPPQVMEWDKNNLSGKVYAKDITETAKLFVPKIKAEGADVIIVIAHSGLSSEPYKLMAENSVYYLSTVKDIDAILFGHTHSIFPGKNFNNIAGIDNHNGLVNGIPAVMPGQWGDHLGVIDLTLEQREGRWHVIQSKSQAKPIFDTINNKALVDPDQSVRAVLVDDFKQTRHYMGRIIGESSDDLFSTLALVQDDPTIQLINNAQIDYVKYYIQGDPDLANLPVISAVAPFKAGSRKNDPTAYIEIPKGKLSVKSVADLYVYANTLAAVKINGTKLKEWLECSAGLFNQVDIQDTQPQYLINWQKFRLYNFDIIDGGIGYEIDITQPPRYDENCQLINPNSQRIKNLTFNAKPIDSKQNFILASNNYRALTGIFPGSGEQNIVINSPDPVKEILARYIEKVTLQQGKVEVQPDNNWRLRPITSPVILDLRIETSPTLEAKAYIDKHAQYPMSYLNNDSVGYAVYRINLQTEN
ncbi:bifunctional 2',3'-cyclic-nucleotide 2'-phosphodiesterase/3'-nucleotidase [Frischella sp. Ac13]|uniref:Bifunctional 2',3'-cyclic-nucleotide 2'-phosphodiesterase/3'-nucleotidase n=1 Tax=Frischella japonica TaxID=2741544 RepID=A0ABR7QW29_9GAMM|nr:bifunctional 2',3'-cyclic-nucleotide 2'-phosphodiesterase/3'-nucleotidase [Frischella japonica]MBC9130261.1 bifunctional 2',3'-cyclic-nucleotide 2'-phosphodiesterase/3'-nucleotidase [Frischella japonica]